MLTAIALAQIGGLVVAGIGALLLAWAQEPVTLTRSDRDDDLVVHGYEDKQGRRRSFVGLTRPRQWTWGLRLLVGGIVLQIVGSVLQWCIEL